MILRAFVITNKNWGSPDIVTLKDVQDMAVLLGLDPYKVEERHEPQPGLYYGKTLVATAQIFRGELRTDVMSSSYGQPMLVLDNGLALGPADLQGEAFKVIHATGKEMLWAAGSGRPSLPGGAA